MARNRAPGRREDRPEGPARRSGTGIARDYVDYRMQARPRRRRMTDDEVVGDRRPPFVTLAGGAEMDRIDQVTDVEVASRDHRLSAFASTPPEDMIDELVAVAGEAGIGLDRDAAWEWLRAVSTAIATPGEFSRTTDGEFG